MWHRRESGCFETRLRGLHRPALSCRCWTTRGSDSCPGALIQRGSLVSPVGTVITGGVGGATYVVVDIEEKWVSWAKPASAAEEGERAQDIGTFGGEMSNGTMATGCR